MDPVSEINFDTLRGLRAGEGSTIVGITTAQASAKRLADMGFVSGARIEMIRPGNPCLVRIGGTCVGLGTANQNCVLVANRAAGGDRGPSSEADRMVGREPQRRKNPQRNHFVL